MLIERIILPWYFLKGFTVRTGAWYSPFTDMLLLILPSMPFLFEMKKLSPWATGSCADARDENDKMPKQRSDIVFTNAGIG